MKIGILTLPLEFNYGGLLQAWALQHVLNSMGHDATIINRPFEYYPPKIPLWRKWLSFLKNEIFISLGLRERNPPTPEELKNYTKRNVIRFIKKNFKGISPDIKTNDELIGYVESQNFDAYVVGSDQVWRPIYSPIPMTFFLDFAKNNDKVKKIAYAVSFGVDDWEYTEIQTLEATELAKKFNLITVRESSGVKLVKDHFGCDAFHVLDPTLLIDREVYMGLVDSPTCLIEEPDGDLFCYILDKSKRVSIITDICYASTGYKPFFCNYETIYYKIKKRAQLNECLVPPVEQWLRSFDKAKMVVTDSFHGTVFSIIFNKPFWVIMNKERGGARFKSLLEQFNLEDRVVYDSNEIDWNKPIRWDLVNTIRSELISNSLGILKSELSSNI